MNFNELEIKKEILDAIEEMGFVEMMPIQAQVIPYILEGCDVIGQAQTGTGKTAAFGIPLIESSSKEHLGVEHLIISPTRELATQIKVELDKLAKYTGITLGIVLGGVDYNKERRMLKENPNILVGTPGRLLDHINNKKLDLSYLKSLTLDEADEMLDIGFKEELTQIIDAMPEERQSMLFSATLSDDVKKLAEKMLHNPVEILVSSGLTTAASVDQYAIVLDECDKFKTLVRLLQVQNPSSVMIFGRTKRRADELSKALQELGFSAKALHGDLTQKERANVMDGFKKGIFKILVATDVAARGIHVDGVEVVYNFDLPQEVEYYVHRIGRTGRAGSRGKSYSFVRPPEINYLRLIEKKTKSKIEITEMPSNTNVKKARKEQLVEMIQKMIEDGKGMSNMDTAVRLIGMFGAETALSAALEIISPKMANPTAELSSEPPVRVRMPESHDHHKRGPKNGKFNAHSSEKRKDGSNFKKDRSFRKEGSPRKKENGKKGSHSVSQKKRA